MTTIKKAIGTLVLLAVLALGSVVQAQTTTPGIPDTAVGVDPSTNLILGAAALIALIGAGYLLSRRPAIR